MNGEFIVTSSYDGTAKIWTTRDYDLLKILAGHAGRVMRLDVAQGGFCLKNVFSPILTCLFVFELYFFIFYRFFCNCDCFVRSDLEVMEIKSK